ncbi:hypothetical protein SDC9_166297 [bioreactor metagenome]|uniref:Uncharacterized protein n=1 Tax=bioreactor metagenome TaxID=1076179 RepID=A0A645FYZ4_9ZZZZ
MGQQCTAQRRRKRSGGPAALRQAAARSYGDGQHRDRQQQRRGLDAILKYDILQLRGVLQADSDQKRNHRQ